MDALETEKTFVPKWKGKADKEITVVIKRLTPAEKNACWTIGDKGIGADLAMFIRKGVPSIKGLTWYGKKILIGTDICDTVGLDILFAEVGREVVSYNTVPVPKN